VFQDGWKPLNYGFVLATLTFCDVAECLFKNGFDFVVGHRFSQDATENIFSQIRCKEGSIPTALKALRIIRLISVPQFVSEVKRSSYMSDSDQFLLHFCKEKIKSILETKSLIVVPNNVSTSKISEIAIQYSSLEDFSQIVTHHVINCTYYIAGSTTNAVTKHVCSTCIEFLSNQNLTETEFIIKAKLYTSGVNQGGLKEPCLEILSLVCHCEYYFKAHKNFILRNENTELIRRLIEDIQILFPVIAVM